jgi:hypothetical protein
MEKKVNARVSTKFNWFPKKFNKQKLQKYVEEIINSGALIREDLEKTLKISSTQQSVVQLYWTDEDSIWRAILKLRYKTRHRILLDAHDWLIFKRSALFTQVHHGTGSMGGKGDILRRMPNWKEYESDPKAILVCLSWTDELDAKGDVVPASLMMMMKVTTNKERMHQLELKMANHDARLHSAFAELKVHNTELHSAFSELKADANTSYYDLIGKIIAANRQKDSCWNCNQPAKFKCGTCRVARFCSSSCSNHPSESRCVTLYFRSLYDELSARERLEVD